MNLKLWLNGSALIPLALVLLATPPAPAVAAPAQPAAWGQDRDRDWERAPGEFNEEQRRGFRDGVEGAHKDFGNHRNPDVNNREEYRNQPRGPYREAFRRGYEMAATHLWGPPVPQPQPMMPAPPPQRPEWEQWGMRGLQSEAERRGYHEGVEAARRDYQTQRRQDPDDHPEYRNPPLGPELAGEFREGFMRGYEVAISQLNGESSWQPSQQQDRWAPPPRFSEMQRRGFQDGSDGARKDFGNHRRPNVANREEYREPHIAPEFLHEYREGFRRGYEMAALQLWGQ